MAHKKHIPTALIILDGFGFRTRKEGNAIAMAHTPNIAHWLEMYPHTLLKAAGEPVGLLEDMIGNSQVGHMTIGCGRVIKQPVTIVDDAIKDGSFLTNPVLVQALQRVRSSNNTVHIITLVSEAGVHGYLEHLKAYITALQHNGIQKVVIHAILDGRDEAPRSALGLLEKLETTLAPLPFAIIGSLHGRWYAMDRDHHAERTAKSYQVLTSNSTQAKQNWRDVLQASYAQNITDEFLVPTQLVPGVAIQDGDGIIFTNIRPDRARQLTTCFVGNNHTHKKIPLSFFITPISYGTGLKTDVLFPVLPVKNSLKEVLAAHEKTMFTIAETEKYAHVTYFFSGGNERIVHQEVRILIPSLRVATYAPYPEMSGAAITQSVLRSLKRFPRDFYLINYANADMVGHSGNLNATIKAVEFLDEQLKKIYDMVVEQMGGTLYITADHGKAEQMLDTKTGQARTAHTANMVPFIMLRKGLEQSKEKLPLKELSDIAPFILEHMGIAVPDEMKKV